MTAIYITSDAVLKVFSHSYENQINKTVSSLGRTPQGYFLFVLALLVLYLIW